MVEAVGDVVEAVGDVVEAVGDVVEAVDVVTGGGVQMCWGIPKESPQTDTNVFPHMRTAWGGACFFCCGLCSFFALCHWNGNDVGDTLGQPEATPGRLADLDLLEVDFLTKWRTRPFAF